MCSGGLQFADDIGAVAMPINSDSHASKHRQPNIAEGGVFREDKMLSEFEICATTGEDSWAIGEIVDGTDV